MNGRDNPLFRQPAWIDAHQRILVLLPSTQEAIPTPFMMAPDPILKSATDAGVQVESVLLFNPWRGDPQGRGTIPFEDYAPLELFDVVFADRPPTSGPLWFISDDCFFDNREPYVLNGEVLREFIGAQRVQLNQDVLFIWKDFPRITVIHHAGGFFHLVFPDG